MNNIFWDDMVSLWCRVIDTTAFKKIAMAAEKHGNEDLKIKSSYSFNPLDDEDDDDDDF